MHIKDPLDRAITLLSLLSVAGLLCLQVSCREAASHGTPAWKLEKERARANREAILHGRSLVKDGDLVLRTGRDFISLTLRQFSVHDNTYSHCGLVRIEDGRVYVYHAIGGEDNPNAKLRRDRFEAFCNPEYNSGFGIFRYNLTPAQHKKLDSLTDACYQAGIKFDLKFDLRTDSSFYCAEFVYKVVEKAAGDPRFFALSHIGSFPYVAIDNLFLTPHATPVYRTVFR